MKKNLFAILAVCSALAVKAQPSFVKIEAESGTAGIQWSTTIVNTDVLIRTTSNGTGGNPGSAERVISYSVTFPRAGTYNLYGRIRVNAGGADDDSYFYGNGFGTKPVTADADWILMNGLASAGFTNNADFLDEPGSAGSNVLKWVNMSVFTGGEAPITFTVPANNLTQTFQIGGREDGLDFDKFVFGLTSHRFTVANLNNGEEGITTPPPPPYVPPGPPIATGKSKFLGGVYSNPQKINFTRYWNQVTPENGGKWGSVEGTRDVMNWAEMDSSYKLAKANGYPFKLHTLIWGSQQPVWIENLPASEQLEEIKEWYDTLSKRYPDIDIIEVVNEPLHQKPDKTGAGNYINALGGNGASGWEWILQSFRLARDYFPKSKLWINDYSIINTTSSTTTYLQIIELLKAENLIDGVGEQGHAFTTFNTPATTLTNNLNRLAAAGLPLYITELDIDGAPVGTPAGDSVQAREFRRVFPLFWEHPAVQGITVWGYLPGHWRSNQGAYLAYSNGAERPALVWLRNYIQAQESILPVNFKVFEAYKSNNVVRLTWTTSDEKNNDRFEIERSTDGVAFLKLLAVSAESGSGDNSYAAEDPLPATGRNFYRLVQFDKDGKKSILSTKLVEFDRSIATLMQVYPNPASSFINLFTDASATSAFLSDGTGRLIKRISIQPGTTVRVSIDGLTEGVYIVKVMAGEKSASSRLIIQKK